MEKYVLLHNTNIMGTGNNTNSSCLPVTVFGNETPGKLDRCTYDHDQITGTMFKTVLNPK